VRRCFYLDVLDAYGAPELTPPCCAGDDWLFEALPRRFAGSAQARWRAARSAATSASVTFRRRCDDEDSERTWMMGSFSFWQRWLFVVALVLVAFGIALALFSQTTVFDVLFNHQINPAFWRTQDTPAFVAAFQGWVYGVLGATVSGWGIFLAFIARYPFRNQERWSWNCMAVGMTVWYVVDTFLSLRFGVVFNATFNTIVLAAVIAPLFATRKAFV
jgi:hypothetical protein